jgi:hypothetical protein
MTDRNKFEEMLERLINEDRAGAEELFHEIVVEKSRDIYQSIIESEDEDIDEAEEDDLDEAEDDDLDEAEDDDLEESDDEDLDESADEEVDESEEDDLDEMFGLDEFEVEADPMADMGGDATDDMMGDIAAMGGDDEGDDEEGEGGAEEAFADLEDALEALKAEFEAMMGGEEGDDEEGEEEPEEESYAFEAEEEDDEDDEEEVEESRQPKSAGEQMREYVEKVSASMGDNGANTQSIVAKPNNMGGSAKNIAQSKTENGVEANKGKIQGSALNNQTAKVDDAGNVNKVGNKKGAATKMSNQPGHGAEKKGKPETADKSASSMLNGAPKRAK